MNETFQYLWFWLHQFSKYKNWKCENVSGLWQCKTKQRRFYKIQFIAFYQSWSSIVQDKTEKRLFLPTFSSNNGQLKVFRCSLTKWKASINFSYRIFSTVAFYVLLNTEIFWIACTSKHMQVRWFLCDKSDATHLKCCNVKSFLEKTTEKVFTLWHLSMNVRWIIYGPAGTPSSYF